jgi:histidinol-phosphate aminotransferase
MRLRQALTSIKPYQAGRLSPGAIKLASNENPLGPSPKAIERITAHLPSISLYPDPTCVELREKLAPRLGVDPEQIIVGNGSDELLVFIAGAYVEPGMSTLTADTTFSEYTFATTLFGGTTRYAPMQDGRFDLSAMAEMIDESTAVAFICNPNNPTGTYITRSELAEFLRAVPDHVLVVVDEAYNEYAEAEDYTHAAELVDSYPNLLVLRTFSKIYGLAGLRIGYGVASGKIVSDLRLTKEPFNVNSVAQAAAIGALDDEGFLAHSRATNAAGKELLYRSLDELGIHYYPTQANFICMHLRKDSMDVFRTLMDRGITIRPLASFGLDEWIRLTIGTDEQNRFFLARLREVL